MRQNATTISPPSDPEPAAVRDELSRVLLSGDFDASPRNRAFLSYVVEETLAGRARLIKGYTIAQSVFKRGAEFDSQLDPVVRIEASRLRRSLEHYYLKAGCEDPIRIDLPRGGYIPTFSFAANADAVPARETPLPAATNAYSEAVGQGAPSVAIQAFRNLSEGSSGSHLANALTEELFVCLIQFANLRVLASYTGQQRAPLANIASEASHSPTASFVLQGSVRLLGDQIRITVQLLTAADGECVWGTAFNRERSGEALSQNPEADIARTIAASLAAPYGIIARLARMQRVLAQGSYDRFLRFYRYRREPTRALHDELHRSLNDAVRASPHQAENWAQLAYMHVAGILQGFAGISERSAVLDMALAAAQRAVDVDERSPMSHLALSMTLFFRHDLERAAKEGQRALALNPSSPEIMAQVGWRLAVPGRWVEGMQLFRQGAALDPDPPQWYRLVLALDGFRRDDKPAALNEIQGVTSFPLPITYVICAGILAAFGHRDEAAKWTISGAAAFPRLFDNPLAELTLYNIDPLISQRLLAGLRRFDRD